MSKSQKQLTTEANILLDTYLREYEKTLQESNLQEDEIADVIVEVKDHMISHCEFKAGDDKLITTDQVRAAIKKKANLTGLPKFSRKMKKQETTNRKKKGNGQLLRQMQLNCLEPCLLLQHLSD